MAEAVDVVRGAPELRIHIAHNEQGERDSHGCQHGGCSELAIIEIVLSKSDSFSSQNRSELRMLV